MGLSGTGRDWLILGCVNVAVPVTSTWERYIGEASARDALIGGLAAICLANVTVILATSTRNGHRAKAALRGFVLGSIGLAALAAAGTVIGASMVPGQNEYLRLALSGSPLDKIHPEQKALVVELIRKQLANSKELERAAGKTKPISPPLFSPASFADISVIRSVSQAYRDATEVDFVYADQQDQGFSEFRTKMAKVDPGYLKSFERAEHDREESTASTLTLEHDCLTATLDLYSYAAVHTKEIAVKNGELVFSNDGVRRDFSTKLEDSKALFDELQATVQQEIRTQEQLRIATGLPAR
jgi:hypothetical protein